MRPHGALWPAGKPLPCAFASRIGLLSLALASIFASACAGPVPASQDSPVAPEVSSAEQAELLGTVERAFAFDEDLQRRFSRNRGWIQAADGVSSPGWRVQEPSQALPLAARLPLRANDPWEIGLGQEEHVRLKLVADGARPSAVSVRDGRAFYHELFPGVDSLLLSSPEAIEQLLVLKATAPRGTLRWRLERDEGLKKLRLEPSGDLVLENAAGVALIRLQAPRAIDSQGKTYQLHWTVSDTSLETSLAELPEGQSVVLSITNQAVTWTQVATTGPSSRYAHAMTATGTGIMLFGGKTDTGTSLNDTWFWNGTTWSQSSPSQSPPVRAYHAMAALNGKVIVFGGQTSSGTNLNDTWQWNGTTWAQVISPSNPPPRSSPVMATLGNRIVLFGGIGSANYTDTWEWDGTSWTERSVFPHPGNGWGVAMATFKGLIYLVAPSQQTTWSYNGTTWTNQNYAVDWTWVPSGMVPFGPQLLMYGQDDDQETVMDPGTLIWSGANWYRAWAPSLGLRSNTALAPLGSSQALLFGGGYPSTHDTWVASYTLAQGSDCTASSECASGLCVDGVCCGSACGGGVPDCQACNVPGSVGTCHAASAGIECRPSTGGCDAPESCDGTSTTCPSDAMRPSGYECRASTGPCDAPETCNGTSAACPSDAFRPNTYACRNSAGDCDLTEYCSGSSASCPNDARRPTSYVCRTASTVCDVAENCDGTSVNCPTDRFASNTVQCRASAGACDVAETCTGSSATCPTNGYRPSSFVCRTNAGDCDVAETCTGSSASCPTDAVRPATYVCRAAAGDCDRPDTCDGVSTGCTADLKLDGSTVCRPSAGVCDLAESCNGTSNSCPTDVFAGNSVTCRSPSCSGGTATLATSCSGSSASCPSASTQACAPYLCSGTTCGTQCTNSSDCAASNSYCNGAHQCVPKLNLGQTCTTAGSCNSGSCVDGVCCDTRCDGQCEACDIQGSAGTCLPVTGAPHGSRPTCNSDGTACGGTCNGTTSNTCSYPGSATECRAASCTSGTATLSARCMGNGSCGALQTQACGANGCAGAQCQGDCHIDTDCGSNRFCNGGVCTNKYAQAHDCTGSNQCQSDHCVDGVCCSGACDGQCEACDVGGHVGSCTPVQGAPHGSRQACSGTDECAYCNGVLTGACSYPGTTTSCGQGRCQDGLQTAQACNGQGQCVDSAQSACVPYDCNSESTQCLGQCNSPNECADGHDCQNHQCVLVGPDAGLDAEPQDGSGEDSSGGAGGSAGSGGSAGAESDANTAGSAGSAGSELDANTAGNAGAAGSELDANTAGNAGSGGSESDASAAGSAGAAGAASESTEDPSSYYSCSLQTHSSSRTALVGLLLALGMAFERARSKRR